MSNNTWYTDRSNGEYLTKLAEHLELSCLIKSAVPLDPNKEHENKYLNLGFEKIIKIDLAGIAGTSLLKMGSASYKLFLELLKKIDELKNTHKIAIKIRFLFIYLYSDFAYAQIEAENRVLSDSPQILNLDYTAVTYEQILSSDTYKSQKDALIKIQNLINQFGLKKENNIVDIRFTCLPLNFSLVNINGTIFTATYSYAQAELDNVMSHDMPALIINNSIVNEKGTKIADVIKKHFHYLWHHPTTLLYNDATGITTGISGKLICLEQIKQPHDVTYENKADAIQAKYNIYDDMALATLRFRVERSFKYMTRPLLSIQEVESVFIAFGWEKGLETVKTVKKWLSEDFPSERYLRVNMVDVARTGENLSKELIDLMRNSTMAIIFFTKDMSVKEIDRNTNQEKIVHYPRPNVLFEYGYLYAQISEIRDKSPKRRIIAFRDPDVVVATDYQDFSILHSTGIIQLDYFDILYRIIDVSKTLTADVANKAIKNFIDRMQAAYNNHIITDLHCKNVHFTSFLSGKESELRTLVTSKFPRFGDK